MKFNRMFNLSTSGQLAASYDAGALRSRSLPSDVRRTEGKTARRFGGSRLRRVLVPLDGTTHAEHAIPTALTLAEQCGAIVQLVHVLIPVDSLHPLEILHNPGTAIAALKRRRLKYLSDLTRQIARSTSTSVGFQVIEGSTVTQALEKLDNFDANLLVMATHQRGAIGRFWWGSVAHSLLQTTSKPVVLVPGSNSRVKLETPDLKHILYPVDGGRDSEDAIDTVLDLGILPEAKHTLLRVIPMRPDYLMALRAYVASGGSSSHRFEELQHLRITARRWRAAGRQVHTRIITSDEPVGPVVVRCATQTGVDMIALAYRRRSSLEKIFHSSTAEFLFRTSRVPLMLIPMSKKAG